MVKSAKNRLKLLGGSITTDDENTEDEASAKATNMDDNKGQVILATGDNPKLSLRKPEPSADRNPKRRKTMPPPKEADSHNKDPEQKLTQTVEPDGVPDKAEDTDDTEMSRVPEVEAKKQTKAMNSDTNWPTSATHLPKGTLKGREHMDNTIAKPQRQLSDVPENGISDTETHENGAMNQLITGISNKLYQGRKRDRTINNVDRERERDRDKKHNAGSKRDRDDKQNSQWRRLPNPILHPAPYTGQATPQHSQNHSPNNAEEDITEPTNKSEPTENTEKQVPAPNSSNNNTTAETKDIDMTEPMEPKESSMSPLDKLDGSWERLENWKSSVAQQLHSLKAELLEDTQLWRQEIARTTVQQIVSSLQETYTGIFTDVEKLKTTTKELLKVTEKQAEAMKIICDKVLNKKQSADLERTLQQKLYKYSVPSPTPTTLNIHKPAPMEEHSETMKMDWTAENKVQVKEKKLPSLTESTMMNPSVAVNPTSRIVKDSQQFDRRLCKKREPEIDHFEYLKNCWNQQIELPLLQPQKRNIYSFKNALVATGYEKILVTWQGMFYEVSDRDIELGNLSIAHSQNYGMQKWVAEGVTVFKWSSRFEHILRPHRFSMKPLQGSKIDWSVFKQDKYYIHVYQTKIARGWKDLRTVHSKTIAQHLSQNWPSQYWPRLVDIRLIDPRANTTVPNRYQSDATSYRPRSGRSDTPLNRNNLHEASEASTLRTRRSANTSWSNNQRQRSYLRTVKPTQRAREEVSQSEMSESQVKQRRRRDRWRRRGAQRNRRRARTSGTSQMYNSHLEKTTYQADRISHRVERNRAKRTNELDDIIAAIQRVSRDVNLLKSRIDRK